MKITDALKTYRNKDGYIKATLAHIEWLKEILKTDNLHLLELNRYYIEPGMPRAKNTISPIEHELCQKELTREDVQKWIDDDYSRLWFIRAEVQQIDIALKALTRKQKSIIEWNYFEGLKWRDIWRSYFETYKEDLSEDALKKINRSAIVDICKILEPFYARFGDADYERYNKAYYRKKIYRSSVKKYNLYEKEVGR